MRQPADGGSVNRARLTAGAAPGRDRRVTSDRGRADRAGRVRDCAAAYGAGMFFLWWGWDSGFPSSAGGGLPVSSFDVRVFAIRRRPGRKTSEVRWRVAGRGPRQVQVVHVPGTGRRLPRRAGPRGPQGPGVRPGDRGPGTGEPESWAAPEPEPVTWYQHAVAYTEMKWPLPAAAFAGQPGRRAGHRHAAADPGNWPRRRLETLRAALYGHAFNPRRRCRAPGPDTAGALAWVERASLPVSQLGDPRVIRAVLDGLCTPAGRLARGGEHDHPQAGSVPRRPRLRRRARAAARQPHRPGALARAQSRRGPSARLRRQSGAGSGKSLPGSPASSRSWPRSSAACTTRRCARKKPSPCAVTTAIRQPRTK